MEAGVLTFDMGSEFKVLEDIVFEEEVARPEALRFFTLDEQLIDYFDKVLPKKGKISKFEYNAISGEVDRLREIYEDVITVTDSEYTVDLSRKEIHVDWVHPIYTNLSLVSYSYKQNWNVLYDSNNRSTPNYYPRMLSALPKPYNTTASDGVSYTDGGILVNEDGGATIHTLPTYQRTKRVLHEDGSFSIIKVPVNNTADDVKVKGFYIDTRPLDIPNPLADHPFLASNNPSKFLINEPLNRVFPTVEAIMTHGVPKTKDPYTEGKKFLKLYDIKLSQIPWNLWKDSFAPVDTISVTPTILSVEFPKDKDSNIPSENIQKLYTEKWYPGIEPRLWLSRQEDNGSIVFKMILSNASSSGTLAPAIVGEKPIPALTPSTVEECFTIETFNAFLNAGVYRSPKWSDVNSAIDKHKALPGGHCIPLAQIVQERTDFLVGNKIAWKESQDKDILKEHQELLKHFQYVETVKKQAVYEKYAGQADSDIRKMIKAVLKDQKRTPIDKADSIEKILRGISTKDNIYFDAADSFLLCGHTLAILKGDMENDLQLFYKSWTTVDEGFRSCISCGERINADVFVSQDDFDENGNPVISSDVLEGGSFHGDTHMDSFATSISGLKKLFQLQNGGEAILYLLMSLLQVLPVEEQLSPIVSNIRVLTTTLRGRKSKQEDIERVECEFGIAGMVTLLQIHNPFLIPRRSFGSKVLKLSGFPRDTDDEKVSPTLDTILSILKTTFESSPNTFTGSIKTFIKVLISDNKKIRTETIVFLKNFKKTFTTLFEAGKARYAEIPVVSIVTQQSLPVLPVTKLSYTPDEKLGNEELKSECTIEMPRSYLTGLLPPNVLQAPMILSKTTPSKSAKLIDRLITTVNLNKFTDAEITRRVKLDFPKTIKLDKIAAFLKTDTDGIAFLSLLNRMLDILIKEGFDLKKGIEYRSFSVYLQTSIQKSLLRDAAKGLVYELLHDVKNHKNKLGLIDALNTATQRDLVFSMILLTKEDATKQDSDLRTRERELFKHRMRQMNDTEREATKMLLDIGIAPYIITNQDRELFAREYNLPDPESAYEDAMQALDIDTPEAGVNDVEPMRERSIDEENGASNEQNRDYDNLFESNEEEGYGT